VGDFKAEEGIITANLALNIASEWMITREGSSKESEVKFWEGDVIGILEIGQLSKLGTLEVADVGRESVVGEVGEAFIKADMIGNLQTLGGNVIPKDVLCSVREETEEDTFLSMAAEFAVAAARRLDIDAATKSTPIGEVGIVTMEGLEGTLGSATSGKGIADA
jgi:hypothetical protein